MTYNFDQIINRRGTCSKKWDTYQADVLPMWVADSDFYAPQVVTDAILKVVNSGVFGYTDNDPAFELACTHWMRTRFNWDIASECVQWIPSICVALATAIRAFTEVGDAVAIMTPVYPPFFEITELNERQVAEISLCYDDSGRWSFDPESVENVFRIKKPKLLLLCNPHNPMGTVFTKAELEKLGELCLKYNVIVFSDEIHSDLIIKGKHITFPTLSKELAAISLVGINPSKTFNVANLRTAAVLSENPELLQKFAKEVEKMHLGRCSFGIAGLIAAYTQAADYADQVVAYLKNNLQFAVDYINNECKPLKTYLPEATYLLWLDCRALNLLQNGIENLFLEKAKVALNPGPVFGKSGTGFMRMNVACPLATLKEGLGRIKNALEKL